MAPLCETALGFQADSCCTRRRNRSTGTLCRLAASLAISRYCPRYPPLKAGPGSIPHLVGVWTPCGCNRTELLYCCLARVSRTLVWDLKTALRPLVDKTSALPAIGKRMPHDAIATTRNRMRSQPPGLFPFGALYANPSGIPVACHG